MGCEEGIWSWVRAAPCPRSEGQATRGTPSGAFSSRWTLRCFSLASPRTSLINEWSLFLQGTRTGLESHLLVGHTVTRSRPAGSRGSRGAGAWGGIRVNGLLSLCHLTWNEGGSQLIHRTHGVLGE